MMKTLLTIAMLVPATQPASPASQPTKDAATQPITPNPVESGKTQIAPVAEFVRLFPDGEHYFSYLRNPNYKPRWNSCVMLFGRYELVMQAEVEMDADRTRVLGWKDLIIHLIEVRKVEVDAASGVTRIVHGELQLQITPEQWNKVVAKDGDFSAIGVELKKDAPVPNIEKVR